jgi:hypothetical protein
VVPYSSAMGKYRLGWARCICLREQLCTWGFEAFPMETTEKIVQTYVRATACWQDHRAGHCA